METIKNQRILFAVLDWGLGHASRSSVLIKQFLENGNKVELVSSGSALNYLLKAFPQVRAHNLGHDAIVYPVYTPFWLSMLVQQSKFMRSIRAEQKIVSAIANEFKPDLIISDNCYGVYSSNCKSVLMTHQLHIKTPFLQKTAQTKIHRLLHPFDEIWIPDFETEKNLSGELSHPPLANKTCLYIGPLSLLKKTDQPDLRYAYCAVISGPEKQRTVFENKVVNFFNTKSEKCCLIRGLTSGADQRPGKLNPMHESFAFLQNEQLIEKMNSAEIIIARSGYSTIMDLAVLQKKSLLFPTPGQTEQAYLFRKQFGQNTPGFHLAPKLISVTEG